MLSQIKDFFFPKPKMIIEVYEGEVKEKVRTPNKPRSYSIYISQSTLDARYKNRPDDYDLFSLRVNSKEVRIPFIVWQQVECGKSVKLVVTYLDPSGSLTAAIKSVGSIKYQLENL